MLRNMNTCRLLIASLILLALAASLVRAQEPIRPYAEEIAADAPDGWWRLGDAPLATSNRAADSGPGNNGGTYSADVHPAPGIPGAPDGAADFAGGHVDIDNPLAFDAGGGALTIEAWVQPEVAGAFRWGVAKDTDNTSLDYLLGMNTDGTWRFITQGLANDLTDSAPSVPDGVTWYHLVAVQDPATQEIRLYVNGTKVGNLPITKTGITSSNPLRIGARGQSATQNTRGRIDEVAFYKVVLSDARIAAHYQAGLVEGGDYAGAVTADAPFGWWRLGDAPPPVVHVAADSGSAKKDGVFQGSVAKAAGIPGAPDGGADFAGGHIDVDDQGAFDSGGSDLTIEAWFQPDTAGAFRWILGKDDSNEALDFLLGHSADAHFRVMTQALSNDAATTNALPFDGTTWYHLVGRQDTAAGTFSLFVNGELAVSKPLSAITGVLATQPLRIGARGSDAAQAVDGRLDEVAIYRKALTPTRIQAHFRSGIYSTNVTLVIVAQPRSQLAVVGGQATLAVQANATGTAVTPTYQWKKNGENVPGATGAQFSIDPATAGDAGVYTVLVSLPGGIQALSSEATLMVVPPVGSFASEAGADAPFAWWSLADAPPLVEARVQDSGSGGNDGTIAGAAYAATGIAGCEDGAGDFAGGHVDVDQAAAFNSGGEALTVEAWVQPDKAGNYRWFVGKDDDNTSLDYLLGMNPDGTFRFITQGLTHDVQDAAGPRGIDGQTWFHLVGVQDPGTAEVRLYVNGELAASVPRTQTGVTAMNKLRIGARGSDANQNVDGHIDEVAIYKAVLAPDRILAHYNAGLGGTAYAAAVQADLPFGWWRLGDLPVQVINPVADNTASKHDGAYPANVFSAPGIPGGGGDLAADFSGAHVDMPEPAFFDGAGGAFTIEVWVQPDAGVGWILGKDDNNVNLDYLLGFNGNKFRFLAQGLVHDLSSAPQVFDGQKWYHVVAVQDPAAGVFTLYVDGVSAASTPIADQGVLAAGPLRLGARGQDAGQAADSRLDEVALYRSALSATRVLAHYTAGSAAGGGYPAVVAADSPVAWWRLGDAPSKPVHLAADRGTGQHPGEYEGGVALAPGIPGVPDGSANFFGGHVNVQNPGAFDSGMTAWTIEAWLQPDAGTGWILGKDDNNTALDYLLGFNGNALRFIAQGLVHDLTSDAITVNGTDWHHVAAVQDPTAQQVRLYVDGLLAKSVAISQSGVTAANRLRIGARGADAAQAVNCRLDEVMVHKRALGADRIAAHYLSGLSSVSPELRLTAAREGTGLLLTWNGGVLQSASEVTGEWSDVPEATSPRTVDPANQRAFFRLRQANP